MIDRDFEKFRGGSGEDLATRLHITLSNTGRFIMNRNLYRHLGKPPAVYLYFSRVRDMIAIEPVTSARLPDSLPVLETNSGYRINASRFCTHFNIKLDSTHKFLHPELRDGKLWLKLAETITVGPGLKKRKRK